MYKFLFDIDPLVHSDPFSRVMKQAKEGRYSVQAYDDATASAAVVAFSYVIITSPSLFLRPSSELRLRRSVFYMCCPKGAIPPCMQCAISLVHAPSIDYEV